MRIQRPGIWYLNPYLNNIDPQRISQGNPNLDSEKSNNVNFNFSKFAQKFSINASLSYTFVNNAIERYTIIANFPESDPLSQYSGASYSTYGIWETSAGRIVPVWQFGIRFLCSVSI